MVYAPKTGIKLPGTVGDYISTPDHNDFVPTTTLDLRCLVALNDWNSGSNQTLIGKRGGSASDFGFQFRFFTDGKIDLLRGINSSSIETLRSTVIPSLVDGRHYWIRCLKNYSTGDCYFYYSSELVNLQWNQIGSAVSGSTNSQYNDTNIITLGTANTASVEMLVGSFVEAKILVDGILVAEFNAAKCKPRYRDSTGKIWTLNGSDPTTEKV